MAEDLRTDLCVIGAGSAGLTIASGAAQMGASVVLIEAGQMGGDCLNTGCVPSKSLLAAARAANGARTAGRLGAKAEAVTVDFEQVRAHVHGVIASIAPHDSQDRFEKLGCRVIRARARFLNDGTIEAGGVRVHARRFVIATGSRAAAPKISGLETLTYFTNETIFQLTDLPRHLLIVGAGPIGCEMAQAFRRLGSRVTVVEMGAILPRDDSEATAVIRRALLAEGVEVIEGAGIASAASRSGGIVLSLKDGAQVEGSHLLIATGRQVNVEDLGLELAGVVHGPKGVEVDRRLRTTNRRIFAAGDVAGGPQFTHVASYHAGIVLRNALFRIPAKVDLRALPWVTYTDPELAQVGMKENDARRRWGDSIRVLKAAFAENDRAQTEAQTEGFAKIIASRNGAILGATIVGAHAGELIHSVSLAISSGLKLNAFTQAIFPYPTLGEINRQAVGQFFQPKLFSPLTRRLVRFLAMFG